jgi:O-antigen ligase
MDADVGTTSASIGLPSRGCQARRVYLHLVLSSILVIALASFVRERGQLLSNISLWFFLISFAVSIWRPQVGLLATTFLLTVTPSLHEQVNALADTDLHAWAYPGVDCCLGFLAAWVLKRGLRGTDKVLDRFPSGLLLLFHGWMVVSAAAVVSRNIWRSASDFSLRGLAYNIWLTRGISWHDDYYPLQDPFFYGVALVMLFAAWTLLVKDGRRLLERLVGVALAGALANVVFALWQKASGRGWVNGDLALSANAFWPDLHSFGAFMGFAVFLGYGFLTTRTRTTAVTSAVGVAILAGAAGIYLSGSRSTLFLMSAFLLSWAFLGALGASGWRRALPLIVGTATAVVIHLTLKAGYRGLSYASIGEWLDAMSADSLNVTLSYRPEIWTAALRMYLAFPLFGLGQGAFYPLSAVSDFSGSEVLVRLGGDGVHNEFLRMLVELGPVGVGLALFAAVPFVRLGSQNLKLVSLYALAGMAVVNLYTNVLLVREMLMLCAIFVGSYVWEAQSNATKRWQPPKASTTRAVLLALVAVAIAAAVEVAMSFSRFPFTYGQRCFQPGPLSVDGWTQGVLRVPIPLDAGTAELHISADSPDLDRRPLDLQVSIIDRLGLLLATSRHHFAQRDSGTRRIELGLPESPNDERILELRPSHCYVPLNLGVTYDIRRLGVRVEEMRFRAASAIDTK